MKHLTCFFLANIFYLAAFYSFACDPSQPCKSKAIDTTAKKPVVKIGTVPAQNPTKPISKKDDKKNSGDFVAPFSWRPAFLY